MSRLGLVVYQLSSIFERLKGKTFFDFQAEGKLSLEAPNYEKKQVFSDGNWQMNKNADSLFLNLEELESYKIMKLTESELILQTDDKR